MKNQVDRLKRPLRSSSPFFLLSVLSLLPPDSVHDQSQANAQQPGAAAREATALTPADGIALAWRDNRCPACGLEGERLFPAAARSKFKWKRSKGKTAGAGYESPNTFSDNMKGKKVIVKHMP